MVYHQVPCIFKAMNWDSMTHVETIRPCFHAIFHAHIVKIYFHVNKIQFGHRKIPFAPGLSMFFWLFFKFWVLTIQKSICQPFNPNLREFHGFAGALCQGGALFWKGQRYMLLWWYMVIVFLYQYIYIYIYTCRTGICICLCLCLCICMCMCMCMCMCISMSV